MGAFVLILFLLLMAALDVHWFFCVCLLSLQQGGLLFLAVCRLLLPQSTGSGAHRDSVVVVQGLWRAGSGVVAHGLSCSRNLCGQGSNPCPLHW